MIAECNVENEEEILIQEKRNCLKLKKGKLKTKKLLNITILDKQPSVQPQTEPKKCKSEVEEICIYQNLESGRPQHLISENK